MIKKRYDFLDLLKAIAIYFVILIHVIPKYNIILEPNINSYIGYIIRLFIEGVPIFITINGYLLINKKFDEKKHFKKIIKLIILLLIWALIETIFFSNLYKESLTIIYFLKNIFKNKYNGTSWFLFTIIPLYILFPIIKYIHDKNKKLYNYLFIVVTIFSVGKNFISLILNLIAVIFSNFSSLFNEIVNFIQRLSPFDLDLLYFIFYFMLGGYIFENSKKLNKKNKKQIVILSLASILTVIAYALTMCRISGTLYKNNYNYYTIFLAIIIVGMFVITSSYKYKGNIFNKFIRALGNNTLGIYFIHSLLYKTLYHLFKPVFPNIGTVLLYSLFILILSLIISVVMKKIPIIKKIVTI